jgi:hypothetical protein
MRKRRLTRIIRRLLLRHINQNPAHTRRKDDTRASIPTLLLLSLENFRRRLRRPKRARQVNIHHSFPILFAILNRRDMRRNPRIHNNNIQLPVAELARDGLDGSLNLTLRLDVAFVCSHVGSGGGGR